MRRSFTGSIVCICVCGMFAQWAISCGDYGVHLEQRWADQAVSSDPQVAARAIERLRVRGPAGLDALLAAHADLFDDSEAPADPDDQQQWLRARQRLFAAVDGVSGQRDCKASRLFWYTDLNKAMAAAQAQNKPILSLRMMGKLTDEYSCANSRFFRTTLYSNAEVSQLLRERFVLHWESVRPVPKVTIDFGDGRQLERTLTGNSIHYVLAADGRVIDALPGLYGPKAFLRGLDEARMAFEEARDLSEQERDALLAQYYRDRMTAIESNWASDLQAIGVEIAAAPNGLSSDDVMFAKAPAQLKAPAAAANPPGAGKAAVLAVGKGRVEIPILERLELAAPAPSAEELRTATEEDMWPKIAALHFDDAELDDASRALIAGKNPTAGRAAELAVSKTAVESPLIRMFRDLQHSIAVDTVRNEYLFRRQILEWLADGGAAAAGDVFALNERVYADLFLTPRNDPWLGLLPASAYSALDNNGVVFSTSAAAGPRGSGE